MMEAIEVQIERKLVTALGGVCIVPVTGLFAEAAEGELKTADATSVSVYVKPRAQIYEPHDIYTVDVEVSLNVDSSESKGGGLFVDEFNAVAGQLEEWATGDGCVQLSTPRYSVSGCQQTAGGDVDFDPTVKMWIAKWNITLSGVIIKSADTAGKE